MPPTPKKPEDSHRPHGGPPDAHELPPHLQKVQSAAVTESEPKVAPLVKSKEPGVDRGRARCRAPSTRTSAPPRG
jgi:hypothetical protein